MEHSLLLYLFQKTIVFLERIINIMSINKSTYNPLPKELRLGFSDIHDIGLFAKEGIGQGTNLGLSHIKIEDTIIRTPLGGFINHSSDANCVKVELSMTNEKFDYKKWNLVVLQDIKEGEELTVKYTFYKV